LVLRCTTHMPSAATSSADIFATSEARWPVNSSSAKAQRSRVPSGQAASNLAISSSVQVWNSPSANFLMRSVGSSLRQPLSMAKCSRILSFFRTSLAAPGVAERLATIVWTCCRVISRTSRCPMFSSATSRSVTPR
jgi:hypothetical protein